MDVLSSFDAVKHCTRCRALFVEPPPGQLDVVDIKLIDSLRHRSFQVFFQQSTPAKLVLHTSNIEEFAAAPSKLRLFGKVDGGQGELLGEFVYQEVRKILTRTDSFDKEGTEKIVFQIAAGEAWPGEYLPGQGLVDVVSAETVCTYHDGMFCSSIRRRNRKRTKRDLCKEKCVVAGCNKQCNLLEQHSNRIQHYCGEEKCPLTCSVPNCGRRCKEDHWHPMSSGAVHHCGHDDHSCGRLRSGFCCACNVTCTISAAVPHARHECRRAGQPCVFMCKIANCPNPCASKDHFHGFTITGEIDDSVQHQCDCDHTCSEICSAPSCSNICQIGRETLHTVHSCGSQTCTGKCSVAGCEAKCAFPDDHHRTKHQRCHCGGNHPCKQTCDAAHCNERCVRIGIHNVHSCEEDCAGSPKPCLATCAIDGCQRACAEKGHHHAPEGSKDHNCGQFHACSETCSAENCSLTCQLDFCDHASCFVLSEEGKAEDRERADQERTQENGGEGKEGLSEEEMLGRYVIPKGSKLRQMKSESVHWCKNHGCQLSCHMQGCQQLCASLDHFHNHHCLSKLDHMCSQPHSCSEQGGRCQQDGRCINEHGALLPEGKKGLCRIRIPAHQNMHQGSCSCLSEYHPTTSAFLQEHLVEEGVAGRVSKTRLVVCGAICDRFGCMGTCTQLVRINEKGQRGDESHIHCCDRVKCMGKCGRQENCLRPCCKHHVHTVEEICSLQPLRPHQGMNGIGVDFFKQMLTEQDVFELSLPHPSEAVMAKAFALERMSGIRFESFEEVVSYCKSNNLLSKGAALPALPRASEFSPTKFRELALSFRAGNVGVHRQVCSTCDCGCHDDQPVRQGGRRDLRGSAGERMATKEDLDVFFEQIPSRRDPKGIISSLIRADALCLASSVDVTSRTIMEDDTWKVKSFSMYAKNLPARPRSALARTGPTSTSLSSSPLPAAATSSFLLRDSLLGRASSQSAPAKQDRPSSSLSVTFSKPPRAADPMRQGSMDRSSSNGSRKSMKALLRMAFPARSSTSSRSPGIGDLSTSWKRPSLLSEPVKRPSSSQGFRPKSRAMEGRAASATIM